MHRPWLERARAAWQRAFLREDGVSDPRAERYVRAAFLVAGGMTVFGTVSSLEYAAYGAWHLMAGLLVASAVGLWVMVVLLAGWSPAVPGHIGIGALLSAAVFLGVFAGGFYETVFDLVWLVPFVAGLLAGFRGALTWSALTVVAIVGMWWATEAGVLPPSAIPEGQRATRAVIDALWNVLAILLVTTGYLSAQRQADERFVEANAALEEEVRERRDAEARARAADRAKTRFLATTSHEIRTPMNGVLGMAELLAQSPLDDEQRVWVETLRTSGASLLGILNEVLDFSKVEAGALEVAAVPFDLARHVEEAARLLEANARLEGLELRVCTDPALPRRVIGDPGRTRQIVVNLVANAVKFTERGGVTVRVARAVDALGAPIVCVTVEDTGIGIRPEDLSSLFEPFKQVDESASRQFGGTGLGLAISDRLARALGGSLSVRSVHGVGSTFELTLPLIEAPSTVDATPPRGARLPVRTTTAPLDVLVVDDDATNRMVARAMLVKLGHRVAEAVDGADALSRLQSSRFDVVFLDAQMPVMDGYEAARHIRARLGAESPRLVALTANIVDGAREEALAAGMDDYLAKPFRPSELARALVSTPASTG